MKSFQSFRLDTENQCLWRGEERVPIPPKAYDVLRYLVENPGRLITQDEILEKLWTDTYVYPEVLRKYILDIRKILGDRHDKPEFIETVTKRGYRFIAPVVEESTAEPTDLPTSSAKQEHPTDEKADEKAAHETSPSERSRSFGKRRLWKLALLPALAVVAAAGMGGYFRLARNAKAVSSQNASIAVLPFADMSPAKDEEYFSDGLAEQLIHDLSKVSGLKVVGRSSAFQFRGKNEDLRDVGRKLGVANILEGSVRREGNHVRITANLIKADDGFQLWSQTYDREINDIFAVQDEIAQAATEALQLKLLGGNGQPLASNLRSANPEAYQAYLQAKYFSARGQDKQDLEKALSYADQAIKLDANYATAWALRSQVLATMAGLGLIENAEGFHGARESAKKAIALDPDLAAGYMAMGMVQINHDWDWDGADASFGKAGLLEPGSADVLGHRAYLTRTLGRVDEAIGLYKQVIALDPLRANYHLALGYELYFVGRYDEARATLQRAQELNPQLSSLHLTRGKILFSEGRQQEALAEMQSETGEWEKLSGEALAYYALGRREESDKALNKLIAAHQNDSAYQIAEAYAYRGETDKAFEWLDRAYRQRDPGTPELKTGPLMKSLRRDPRYAELLKKMRLPK
jgi:TolB-like protein/DNA-binding winged helix-turn-helix (wHTH) protein/Flp pilus assembly protein TadD